MTHIHRDNLLIPNYSYTDVKRISLAKFYSWPRCFCFDMSLADAQTYSSIILFLQQDSLLCLFLSLSGSKTLARHRHGNRESPTRCQGNQGENMNFFLGIFFCSDKVWESFSAMLLRSRCERGCMCVFPVGPFGWKSFWFSWVCKILLKTDRFTWPCPRPQPFPFYLSGTPVSAGLSSVPANHNMVPERGQKG